MLVTTTRPKKVLKRRLPINDDKLSFEPRLKIFKTSSGTSNPSRLATLPSAQYYELLILNQAGEAFIAHDNSIDCKLLAIRKRVWNGTPDFECRQEVQDGNIVNLIEMFIKDNQVYLVYEQMEVSLDLINGIPRGRWQAFEVAGHLQRG